VHEPRHYFGDFFDGVVPLPANSTVWDSFVIQSHWLRKCTLWTVLFWRFLVVYLCIPFPNLLMWTEYDQQGSKKRLMH
jgi:hypothetical protein